MTNLSRNLPAVVSGPVQQNFDALNSRLAAVELNAAGELPKSAQEGEQALFEAAPGLFWHLVYTGEATYPWAVLGGGPGAMGPDGTSRTPGVTTAVETFARFTAPLAMEFYAHYEITGFTAAAAVLVAMTGELFVGGVAQDVNQNNIPGGFAGGTYPRLTGNTIKAAKGNVIEVRYATSAASNPTFSLAYGLVFPVRVG